MSDPHHRTNPVGRGGDILQAALELFSQKGFAATSVREIVLRAGVTKPALYYHFGSKEGLLRAIVDQGFDELDEVVRQKVAQAADARDALVKFLEASFEIASRKPQLASLIYQVIFGSETSPGGIDVSTIAQRNRDVVMGVIHRAVEDGLIRPERAEKAGLLLSGLMNIHLMSYLKGEIKELSAQQARDAVDLYLNGVASSSDHGDSSRVREG